MPSSSSPSPFGGAQWLASTVVGGARTTAPVPYFRKAFTLTQGVKSARLSITALGLYEAEINGQRVGDHIFAPGWTEYRKRVSYQTYEVGSLLKEGDNALGALLGDGWYCGFLGWGPRQVYGDRPRLIAALEIALADGSSLIVGTDSTWKTSTGPILSADLLMGEAYDARLELGEWSEAGFDDSAWQNASVVSAPEISLDAPVGPPVRAIEELAVVTRSDTSNWSGDKTIIDFGQNFSGRARVSVKAPRGTNITIRHAEILNPDGNIYTENLRDAKCTDYYTCRGGDEGETWEPRFTFHGFRYVQITGAKADQILSVTGVVLHSDTPTTGAFACSHPELNQLQKNIDWGQRSNFLEVPTDCPQRDERLGWTGDAQVFIRTACFNRDVQSFFHKWMQDARDAQRPNGGVPPVIPSFEIGLEDGGPAWADATIICPWTIYLCYADRKILEDHYDSMVRYMDFMAQHRCQEHIRSHPDVDSWGGFGDWLALDGGGKTEGITPRDLIGTAFYAYDAELMAKIARVLGREDEAKRFDELHQKVVAAFRRRFVTEDGLLAAGTQTAYVLALRFGLVPEKARLNAVRELVRDIEKREFHIATGFVGTPYILDVLEEAGHLDIAYKLLEQKTFPSWLFPIQNGATTIWERWDGWTPEKGFQDKGMNSFNHYAYGAVGAWMYRSVAGLDLDPAEPGYAHIIFRPRPGGSLTWAEASLESPHGKVGIRWKLDGGNLKVTLTVPENTRATFVAPAGYSVAQSSFGPGIHRVVAKAI